MLDWDGCLAVDDVLRQGAVTVVAAARRFAIVSNNSTLTAQDLAARAADQGLMIEPSRVHLAGEAVLREAARRLATRRVWLVACHRMTGAAEGMGLIIDDTAPEAVIVMRDEGFDYAKLTKAVALIARGAQFWAANLDHTHPGRCGAVPETGALAAAIAAAADRRPDLVAGKPHPAIFRQALAGLDCSPAQALMVGDNPRTDLAGARRLGVRAVRVDAASWVTS
ncbi:HAD-IIA family hydrolase [Phenylobacterium sp.]|uniref:HAD-IIA family hydrolase n=1 Tax=Phenylobacterium sp. TaxID=1871053 RepID=UPI0035C83526